MDWQWGDGEVKKNAEGVPVRKSALNYRCFCYTVSRYRPHIDTWSRNRYLVVVVSLLQSSHQETPRDAIVQMLLAASQDLKSLAWSTQG